MTRLLDPDSILRTKIVEFVGRGDFGLASEQKPDGTYERVWFGEIVASEEIAFESGVFLLMKPRAEALKAGTPPEPLPGAQQAPESDLPSATGPEPEAEPPMATHRRTIRVVGTVPPELWNRLGTKILPKLRSGSELAVGVEFSISVEGDIPKNLPAELRQILDDLSLTDRVRIDSTE